MSDAVDVNDDGGAGVPTLAAVWERKRGFCIGVFVAAALLVLVSFFRSFVDIVTNWNLPDSLYSHALIIPPISLFFVWRLRTRLLGMPVEPSLLGYPVLALGCGMLLLGDFLGFMTIVHLALLPVLTGLCLLFLGRKHTQTLWFSLAFLFFMIPMPYTLTSGLSFQSKMLATESAVALGKTLTLHMVQDGSYVYIGDAGDRLLVGDVCGGMRSLVALLAFGALMAYVSKARWWAKILILLVSPAIAILANVSRIFFLCVVGYVWGSDMATGWVHDISGIGIFAVAFALLFSVEAALRKFAPEHDVESQDS
ncbi:MAG: exosortase/archaeosortase family protein [Candidatus Hydrogenedentes bacterium]|nr:exosortase/archaeosortase family protein [Candidatus Hydrogenedentota bacterium]